MLSEMWRAERFATGARYYASNSALTTANLGSILRPSVSNGDGPKIQEIIKRGPFDVKNTGVTAGSIIESIDGEEIKAGMDYHCSTERLAECTPRHQKRQGQEDGGYSEGYLRANSTTCSTSDG